MEQPRASARYRTSSLNFKTQTRESRHASLLLASWKIDPTAPIFGFRSQG
jgi:hypothetical protein